LIIGLYDHILANPFLSICSTVKVQYFHIAYLQIHSDIDGESFSAGDGVFTQLTLATTRI